MQDGKVAEKTIRARRADVGHERADEMIAAVAEPPRFRPHLGADVGMAGQRAGCGGRGPTASLGKEAQGRFHCNASKSGGLTPANKSNHLRQPPALPRRPYPFSIAMLFSVGPSCCSILLIADPGALAANVRTPPLLLAGTEILSAAR